MLSERKKQSTSSNWGLTAVLAVIIFSVITALVSLMAWFGCMGVKVGQITETTLLENPRTVILAICFISLILGGVIMSIVQKLLIGPVCQMTAATQRLAAGDFDTRIHLNSRFRPREIIAFSKSFNKTAEALGSVEILRTDFINNFSHEFKTPIHSLVGIAELLRSGDCSPEETKEYLDIIIDQSKRLASLSTNVLYLTKLETGQAALEMTRFNLSELLRQKLVMFDHKCSEKELEMEVVITPVELWGNADLISQMMGNILDNAIKFSPVGSSIAVELFSKAGYAVFKVKDHGYGMERETIDRIFDKFYQGDTSHSAEGFGLGLPMVKKIVELHHGQLTVESEIGKGTLFTIELPLFASVSSETYVRRDKASV